MCYIYFNHHLIKKKYLIWVTFPFKLNTVCPAQHLKLYFFHQSFTVYSVSAMNSHTNTFTFSLSHSHYPLIYSILLFFFTAIWISVLPNFLSASFSTTHPCCFGSSHTVAPSAPSSAFPFLSLPSSSPPLPAAPSLGFVSCLHSLFFSLSLPNNTPTAPETKLVYSVSALCSCDGNLSFKYLFLPSPDFLSPSFPYCCHHCCTPHSIPEILNVLFPTWLLGTLRLATFNSDLHIGSEWASRALRRGKP